MADETKKPKSDAQVRVRLKHDFWWAGKLHHRNEWITVPESVLYDEDKTEEQRPDMETEEQASAADAAAKKSADAAAKRKAKKEEKK